MLVPRIRTPEGELAAALRRIRDELELPAGFPAAVEAEAAVVEPDLPSLDRTDIPFITIDPAGATDLDQAMHLERRGDGYRVRYAIADVPAFVRPGGAIDAEARRRGQTLYVPDGRIPLHPTRISEGAASLLPGQIAPAFVWEFDLDAAGTVERTTLTRAMVRSTRRLSYVEAQEQPDPLLREIGELRIEQERARGGASLDRPDQEVVREGGRYRLIRRRPLPVENWNAQLSLMTGMAAARIMLDGGVGLLRTMPAPDEETLAAFRMRVAALGLPWPEGQPYGEYLRSLDRDSAAALAVLQSAGSLFRGAGYTAFDGAVPDDVVQAAVAAPYAHTTAPLRRLVDRFVLVTCHALLDGREVPGWVREALPGLPKIMNRSDGLAGRLERASVDAIEAALLHGREGEEFDAVVIAEGSVQLDEPPVTAKLEGDAPVGERVRVRLVTADIAAGITLLRPV
ncbi:MAG TPA: RNB domain-containing ribonuclease [Rhodoglobus sp.]|nr:RNB domain-containing ribonuclease [Rhodoglobus sp.]